VGNNRSNANVPTGWSQQDRRFGESIKQNLDVLQGQRGDKLDRAVTFRDLLDAGIVQLASGITNFNGLSSSIATVNEFPDLAIPPAPTNLQASGAFRNIILTWDLKLYNGHSAVQVWRHTSDVISSATMVAQVSGFTGVYADPVGSGKTFYYWVRAVNQNDVVGPYNSSSGAQGVTAPDVDFLLSTLTTAITSSELASSLSTPIAKIDPLVTFTGYSSSYSGGSLITRLGAVENSAANGVSSAQFNSEVTTRASADSALSQSISTVSSTVAGNTSSISTQATSINGLSGQYTVKIDVNGAVAGYGLASTRPLPVT
jgi:predicted phage tail protein